MQRTELRIEMHSLERTKYCTLPWQAGKTPFNQLLSEKFRPVVAQWKLYVCLLAYKSAEQPWEAPCGLTFTGWSLFPYRHISLCFYSKSLSPSNKRRRGVCRSRAGGGASQLNEYKSGDQPVTECWTAGFEDLTPFVIFACCIQSQFTEPKGSGEAEWSLILSLKRLWPEAEPTCLFTACFMFVSSTMGS